jgi:cytochrome c peroxidase
VRVVQGADAAQRGLETSFFHNGIVHSLRDAVAFYAQRDARPDKWCPVGADGRVHLYDDLPAAYAGSASRELPFGGKAALSDANVTTSWRFSTP